MVASTRSTVGCTCAHLMKCQAPKVAPRQLVGGLMSAKILSALLALASSAGSIWPSLAGQTSGSALQHPVVLLAEFRPIGGVDNNLKHPGLNATPGSPERNLVPLHFAPGTIDGLISSPNPRL